MPRFSPLAALLVVLLTFPLAAFAKDTDEPAPDESQPVAVPAASPLAIRFYVTGNWIWVANHILDLGIPALLLFTGASAKMRNAVTRKGRPWFFVIALYVVLYLGIMFLLDFPMHYYMGYVRPHAYGLSNQSLGRWFGNSLKALAVSTVTGVLFAWIPFALIARSPKRWWLYLTLLIIPFLFGVMLVKPTFVDPLFNKFGPMQDKALESKILDLAARAGIEGSRVFEVDKSRDTKTVNAYVTGFLGTKRIVLWDTLIKKLNERELLFVMGHEMGHYALGHVVRSVFLSSFIVLASLFFVDRAGHWLMARTSRFGFNRLSDVASVPLIMMLMHVATLALMPVVNFYSRHQEFEADRFALELTHSNHSGALAFVKLQEQNLSNPRPGLLFKTFRSTHPSIGERIDFCNSYHPWTTGAPLVYGMLFRE